MKATTSLCEPKLNRKVTTSTVTFSAKDFVTQRVGEVSDVYEIQGQLGAGGYGEVYACVHKETGIERAVKILDRSESSEEANEEVMQEFSILKQLDHPNIMQVFDLLFDESHYYIVTEICRGGELFDEIQEWGNFIEEDAAEVMRTLLAAVNYCK